MYVSFWQALPGTTGVKVGICVVIAVFVFFALMFWVYPLITEVFFDPGQATTVIPGPAGEQVGYEDSDTVNV